jgi:hypothetical protein
MFPSVGVAGFQVAVLNVPGGVEAAGKDCPTPPLEFVSRATI